MKRGQLIKHLNKNGCVLFRNGANHDIYINSKTLIVTSIGRHTELHNNYCKMVCKQLGIPII